MIDPTIAVIPTAGQLFGIAAVLCSIALLLFAIRAFGLWIASERRPRPLDVAPQVTPETAVPAGRTGTSATPVTGEAPDEETLVVLAAAVAAVTGRAHRIVAVSVPRNISSEMPVQVWSLEGRRQIYSSHQVR